MLVTAGMIVAERLYSSPHDHELASAHAAAASIQAAWRGHVVRVQLQQQRSSHGCAGGVAGARCAVRLVAAAPRINDVYAPFSVRMQQTPGWAPALRRAHVDRH
eukprot:363049-Chlamydomonas_euryale.AAC.6